MNGFLKDLNLKMGMPGTTDQDQSRHFKYTDSNHEIKERRCGMIAKKTTTVTLYLPKFK